MELNFLFFINCILLGIGLAMDAFSVSLANGLSEPKMEGKKALTIAGLFALFQAIMPLLGWLVVHSFVMHFAVFEKAVPFIALALLLFIGIKMIIEGVKIKPNEQRAKIGVTSLLMEGVATSIDALSVGFTIASYGFLTAFIEAMIIMIITFGICLSGINLGKKFGTKFSGKAEILGGVILIIIGLEIFVKGII